MTTTTRSTHEIAEALRRAQAVFQRRPEAGLHDDAPATARWQGGTCVASSHANGTQMLTDMPAELGGSGSRVTPGWLFRAGVASCAATRIAMAAATEGIELSTLEVHAGSRSDARGLLGMAEADGSPVCAAPLGVDLQVRIAANDVPPERLRSLVHGSMRLSPMSAALQNPVPMALQVEVVGC